MIDTHLRIYIHLDGLLALLVVGTSAVAAAFVLTGALAFVLPTMMVAWALARYGKYTYLELFGCPVCQMEIEAGKTCPKCGEMGLVTPCEHTPGKSGEKNEESDLDEQEDRDELEFMSLPFCTLHRLMGYKETLDARFKEWEGKNPYCRAQKRHAGQILLVDKE